MQKLKGVNSGFVNGLLHVTVPFMMILVLALVYPAQLYWFDVLFGTLVLWVFMFRVYVWIVRRYIGFQDDA